MDHRGWRMGLEIWMCRPTKNIYIYIYLYRYIIYIYIHTYSGLSNVMLLWYGRVGISWYIIVALNRSRRKSCNLRMERVAFASKTNTWLTLNGNNPEDSKVSNILVDILCPTVFHQSSSAAQDANAPAISVILTDLWIPLESLVVTFNSTHSIINKTEISKPNPWSGWKKNKVWAETSNRLILKKQHFLSRFASFAIHELVEAPAARWSARSCLWPQDIGSGGDNPSLFLLSPKLHQHMPYV